MRRKELLAFAISALRCRVVVAEGVSLVHHKSASPSRMADNVTYVLVELGSSVIVLMLAVVLIMVMIMHNTAFDIVVVIGTGMCMCVVVTVAVAVRVCMALEKEQSDNIGQKT